MTRAPGRVPPFAGVASLRAAKAELRKQMQARRADLAPERRTVFSDQIARRVSELPEFLRARAVHLFLSMGDEVETLPLFLACVEAGKRTCVPVQEPESGNLLLASWQPGEPLQKGPFGVPEPLPGEWEKGDAAGIDLVLAPGLAFDRAGSRLGYGKGYYDRFLAELLKNPNPPDIFGLAFGFQVIESVPVGARDIKVQGVVTEQETIRIDRRRSIN